MVLYRYTWCFGGIFLISRARARITGTKRPPGIEQFNTGFIFLTEFLYFLIPNFSVSYFSFTTDADDAGVSRLLLRILLRLPLFQLHSLLFQPGQKLSLFECDGKRLQQTYGLSSCG